MTRPSFSGGKTILLRILFIVMITGIIMAGVLKMLERAGDPLRQGVERYIADVTKNNAYLGAMPDPKIIPNVRLTLEEIIISDKDDATKKLASVERFGFSLPFINTLIGRRVFESLSFKNVFVEKGVVFPRVLNIAQGMIEEEAGKEPVFHLSGTLGGTAVSMVLDLEKKGNAPPRYRFPDGGGMTYRQGDIHVTGTLVPVREGVQLKDAVMSDESGQSFGPRSFFLLKNQSFVKDNPVSCLMELEGDSKLTATHPCAMLFEQQQ